MQRFKAELEKRVNGTEITLMCSPEELLGFVGHMYKSVSARATESDDKRHTLDALVDLGVVVKKCVKMDDEATAEEKPVETPAEEIPVEAEPEAEAPVETPVEAAPEKKKPRGGKRGKKTEN